MNENQNSNTTFETNSLTLTEKIKKWYRRFKIFTYLFAIWAVIYSTVNITGLKIAFEYDDGIVYTTSLFKKAENLKGEEFYRYINTHTEYEIPKLIPYLILITARMTGFKVDLIIDREPVDTDAIFKKWKNLADNIYFVRDQNEKYEILQRNSYLVYFTPSDEGVIQAKKAEIKPVRIKKNLKSILKYSYNPGKFNEKILPLSAF